MCKQMEKTLNYKKWWDSVAYDYERKVLSPLYPGVKNPVYDFVASLNSEEYKRVADLGCGRGELLIFLAERFEEVWGIDWSDKMLSVAEKTVKGKTNVHLKKLDIRNLKTLYGHFDLVFTINTIAPATPGDAKRILREIFKSLRAGGLFVAIFPSFDTVLYQRDLTYTAYVENRLPPREAREKTDDYFVGRNKLDLERGMYADDGVHSQKFFTEEEVNSLLTATGFQDVLMKKVLYPWDLAKKHGYGYFPGQPEIWDWFASARRP